MGIFFPDEPDYFPDQRPVGFKRYAQVLERDWKRFFLVDLLTLGSLIPFGLGMGYAVLSSSVLVLIPVCILGGLIAGPGLAGMYDMLLRGLRDNVDDWWFSYKKAMRQNWKASLVPGVVMCLFLGFLIFACAIAEVPTARSAPVIIARFDCDVGGSSCFFLASTVRGITTATASTKANNLRIMVISFKVLAV